MRFGKGFIIHIKREGEDEIVTSNNYIPEREVSFFVWVYLHIKYFLLNKLKEESNEDSTRGT